jgi:hypothetical protein
MDQNAYSFRIPVIVPIRESGSKEHKAKNENVFNEYGADFSA